MKKLYTKPQIEIEVYQLDAAIAANCGVIISMGPGAPGVNACKEFGDSWVVTGMDGQVGTNAANTPFYADGSANCDCYYTSGGNGYFTS